MPREPQRSPTQPMMLDNDAIFFYSTRDPYGAFSNFAAYPLTLKGRIWPTSEHYFHAQKFARTPHEEEIRLTKSPTIAARMGRSRARPLRADWDVVKDKIMLEAVRAKFTQHPALRELLLGTGEARIVEHTSRDRYWGDGSDGSGENKLGQILMRVRDDLRGTLASA